MAIEATPWVKISILIVLLLVVSQIVVIIFAVKNQSSSNITFTECPDCDNDCNCPPDNGDCPPPVNDPNISKQCIEYQCTASNINFPSNQFFYINSLTNYGTGSYISLDIPYQVYPNYPDTNLVEFYNAKIDCQNFLTEVPPPPDPNNPIVILESPVVADQRQVWLWEANNGSIRLAMIPYENIRLYVMESSKAFIAGEANPGYRYRVYAALEPENKEDVHFFSFERNGLIIAKSLSSSGDNKFLYVSNPEDRSDITNIRVFAVTATYSLETESFHPVFPYPNSADYTAVLWRTLTIPSSIPQTEFFGCSV